MKEDGEDESIAMFPVAPQTDVCTNESAEINLTHAAEHVPIRRSERIRARRGDA